MGKGEGCKCFHLSINADKKSVLLAEGLGLNLLQVRWGDPAVGNGAGQLPVNTCYLLI